ncbi:hypothetical protein [Polycladospora coralii]|nr:hypothetical protein [Polycladospora coralii]
MVTAVGKVTRGVISFKKAVISPEMLNAHWWHSERKEKTFEKTF